jgi:uncharacterized protein
MPRQVKHCLALALIVATAGGCGRSTAANDNVTEPAAAVLFPLTGRVVDRADLISPRTEQALSQKLAGLEAATTDQFVIATTESLDGRPIEEVGLALGNGWGIGQKGKANGVILLVAPNERKVRIEVGLGLEATLTNQLCAQIIADDILPYFREGRMEAGIVAGADALIARLQGRTVSAREAA